MRELFIPKKFQDKTLILIHEMNNVVDEYQERGFVLTLRQLYYQLVARAIVPVNTQQEYKRVGSIVNDARLAGEMDWDAIEDRTRNLNTHTAWANPAEIIEGAANSYQENLWRDQEYYVEVWIEKEALLGVIERVCLEYRIPYFACKGNNSQSEAYRAGKRLQEALLDGLKPVILHLGDHDPNGIDMTRDNCDRLSMFAGAPIDLRRIALNIEQVRKFNPPPNFAKESDSRYKGYVDLYGEECWELDALDPDVIGGLIRDEIEDILDLDAFSRAVQHEEQNKEFVQRVSENWAKVENMISNIGNA